MIEGSLNPRNHNVFRNEIFRMMACLNHYGYKATEPEGWEPLKVCTVNNMISKAIGETVEIFSENDKILGSSDVLEKWLKTRAYEQVTHE